MSAMNEQAMSFAVYALSVNMRPLKCAKINGPTLPTILTLLHKCSNLPEWHKMNFEINTPNGSFIMWKPISGQNFTDFGILKENAELAANNSEYVLNLIEEGSQPLSVTLNISSINSGSRMGIFQGLVSLSQVITLSEEKIIREVCEENSTEHLHGYYPQLRTPYFTHSKAFRKNLVPTQHMNCAFVDYVPNVFCESFLESMEVKEIVEELLILDKIGELPTVMERTYNEFKKYILNVMKKRESIGNFMVELIDKYFESRNEIVSPMNATSLDYKVFDAAKILDFWDGTIFCCPWILLFILSKIYINSCTIEGKEQKMQKKINTVKINVI